MAEDLRRNADDQEGASAAPPSSGAGGGGNASGDPHWTDSDDEVYGDLDPEVADAWGEMSDDERDAVLDAIIAEQAAKYGIDPPDITYDSSMADNEFGSWNDGSQTLTLNPTLLDDPRMAINTIVHEMRHAGQHEMIRDANPSWWDSLWGADPEYHEGTSPETVEAWQENFDDYQSTDNGDTFREYWDQPVEVDAREAGRDYVDDMGAEDLQQLREAAEEARQEPSEPQQTTPPPLPGPPGPAPTPPSPTPGPRPTPPPDPGG